MKTMNKNILEIEDYLDFLYSNPKCELNYNNDYELLIAVMLSARTTDKQVNKVTKVLFNKCKTLEELNALDILEIKEIIKPLGNYNIKSKNIKQITEMLINKFNGKVPNNLSDLEKFNGVGRKVANVVLSEYFKIDSFAVDTHVSRVSKRLGLVDINDNPLRIEEKLTKMIKKENWSKRHLQFVLFGRYNCLSVKPKCENCKLKSICSYFNNNEIINKKIQK